MKNILVLLLFFSLSLMSCEKAYIQPDFENKITYKVSRSDIEGRFVGEGGSWSYFVSPNLFRPQNVEGKRLLQAQFRFANRDTEAPFSSVLLDIIFALPLEFLEERDDYGFNLKEDITRKNILENAKENLEMTMHINEYFMDGTANINGIGQQEQLKIDLKKMHRFTDENGEPKAYLEGEFSVNASVRSNQNMVYDMDGNFKIVIDLVFK